MDLLKTFQKNDVSPNEAAMQLLLSTGILKGQTPAVHSYNAINNILVMQKIDEMCVSDMYGEHMSDVPKSLVDAIREIIKILYDNNIEYPDITGYNFIYTEDDKDDKLYIIDMEHAKFNTKKDSYDPFILKFIKGDVIEWNERFM